MPTPAKGNCRWQGERWVARITLRANTRVSIHLATCKRHEDEKARERTTLLAQLAKRLRQAGHLHLAKGFLDRAAARDGQALEDVVAAVDRLCNGEAAPPISTATSFEEFARQWTSGELHKRWPDHVKKKRSAQDDQERLAAYVYPLVGQVPLPEFGVQHADLVMSSLPTHLSPATRRHVAQCIARVLKLAAYPARIIGASPLPAGFLPPLGKRKAFSFLYPDEDTKLLACAAVPLCYRVLYGFLSREGMRRSEATSLTWSDIDLERGALALDENKTDDPRAWALDPGVARALRAWRALRGGTNEKALVFSDEAGEAIGDRGDGKACVRLRAHLEAAGVDRPELFERSSTRQPIRMHDLRATFITVALANGRTETWVADRTGHTSSVMINRYRRAARRVAELGLGDLAPLDEAIPELRGSPEKPPGSRAPDQGEDPPIAGSDAPPAADFGGANSIVSGGLAEAGVEPARPCGQRILNPSEPPGHSADPRDSGGSEGRDATDRDGSIPIRAPSIPISGNREEGSEGASSDPPEHPRAILIRSLGRLTGELAAAGDIAGARIAHEALGRLLDAPVAPGDERAEVVDLALRRKEREP